MTNRVLPTGVPGSTMAVLMLSVFTVSMGYGVMLGSHFWPRRLATRRGITQLA
jgi:hypothetical protein